MDARGRVNYSSFLDRYRVIGSFGDAWEEEVVDCISRRLFHACANLEQAFKLFDVNADGTIDFKEFTATLATLDLGMHEEQVHDP